MKTLSTIATCAALALTILLVSVGFVKCSRPYIEADNYKRPLTSLGTPISDINVIRLAAERNGIKYATDDWYILLAIRKAENGANGRQFGILNPKADNLDKQAGWCAASIVKGRQRWDGTGDFVEFMGRRYCPPSAHPLNVNWVGNVNYWKDKLEREAR
jgi:hypothetical protein